MTTVYITLTKKEIKKLLKGKTVEKEERRSRLGYLPGERRPVEIEIRHSEYID